MTNCDICNEPIHRQPHPTEHMINSCSVCGWHSMLDEDEQTRVKPCLNSREVIGVVKNVNSLLSNMYTHYVNSRGDQTIADLLDETGSILKKFRVPINDKDISFVTSITPEIRCDLMARERRLQTFFSSIRTIMNTEDLYSDKYKEMMTALCEQYSNDREVKKALSDWDDIMGDGE